MLKLTTDLNENIVFIEAIERESKKGNKFTMVSFGLPDHYKTLEFFKDDTCSLEGLKKGDKVKITVGCDRNGYNQSYNLVRVTKVN